MERNYTIKETANILGIKVRTCREWIKTGKINATKYSGSNMWRISENEINRVLKGKSNED